VLQPIQRPGGSPKRNAFASGAAQLSRRAEGTRGNRRSHITNPVVLSCAAHRPKDRTREIHPGAASAAARL